MLINKIRFGFVIACIGGIIYGMSTENYYGTFWAAVSLVSSINY